MMFAQSPVIALGQSSNVTMNMPHGDIASYGKYVYVAGLSVDGSNHVVFRESSDEGNNFGDVVTISDSVSNKPKIAAYDKNVYTVWASSINESNHIFFRQSSDNGLTFNPVIDLENNTGGFAGSPTISAYGNNVYVVWVQENNTANELSIKFRESNDNGTTFGNVMTLYVTDMGWDVYSDITANENGVYVVWHTSRFDVTDHIFIRRSVNGGSSFEPAIDLTNIHSMSGGYPSVVTIGDNVYVTWFSESTSVGGSDIFVSKSSDRGNTFGEPLQLTSFIKQSMDGGSEVNALFPSIATSGGDVYVSWDEFEQAENGFHKLAIWKESVVGNTSALARFSSDGSGFAKIAAYNDVYILYDNVFLKFPKDSIVSETPPPRVHDFIAVQNGNWDEPATWGGVPPPMVIDGGETVGIPAGINVNAFDTIENSGKITVNGSLLIGTRLNNIEGGAIENNGNTEINIGTLSNSGIIENHGSFQVSIGVLYNYGRLNNTGSFTSGVFQASGMINGGIITNNGNFYFIHSGNDGVIVNNNNFTIGGMGGMNNGLLNNTGTLIIATDLQNGGTINNLDGATLQNDNVINNSGNIINFCGARILNNGHILGNAVQQQSCLEILKDEVKQLQQDDKINSGEANSLTVKLQNVTDSMNKDRSNTTCPQIQSFVNEVDAMTNAGRLDYKESNLLRLMAQELQETYGCTNFER